MTVFNGVGLDHGKCSVAHILMLVVVNKARMPQEAQK